MMVLLFRGCGRNLDDTRSKQQSIFEVVEGSVLRAAGIADGPRCWDGGGNGSRGDITADVTRWWRCQGASSVADEGDRRGALVSGLPC
jgi:hypothetical protein